MRCILSVLLTIGLGAAACSSSGSTDAGSSSTVPATAPSTTEDATTTTSAVATDGALAEAVIGVVGAAIGGAAVLSIQDGVVTTFATGSANASGDQIEPDQPFRVGSISKPFVATMIMQLVDEESLDLDETLGAYLPSTPLGADVTVRQLLAHESGIPNYTDQLAFMSSVMSDPAGAVPLQDTLASVADEPSGPVGTFSYSNTNYILLGQLIEAIEQDSLNNVLAQRITKPLGLANTYFADVVTPAGDDVALGWSEGFSEGDIPVSYRSLASVAWAAGSLISTTQDLATFLDALLREDLVSIESLGQMTFTGTDGYGLGLMQFGLGEGKLGYGHSGQITGYTSTMAMDPLSGDAVVVLTNNDRVVADLIATEIILGVWSG